VYLPEQVKICLKDLSRKLDRHNVKYIVLGATPLQFYGRPRTSVDVDIVLTSYIGKERLLKILSDRYKVNYEEKILLKFRDSLTGVGVDIILSLRHVGLTRESLKRVKKVRFNDSRIIIPCPEDYIITKLVARRPDMFDFSDVMSVLLYMGDKINWEYLLKRAKQEKVLHLIEYYREGLKRKVG